MLSTTLNKKKSELIDSLINDTGNTLLHKYAMGEKDAWQLYEELIEEACWGFDGENFLLEDTKLSVKNSLGWTALHIAAALGNIEMVAALIKEANSIYRTSSWALVPGVAYDIDVLTTKDKKNALSLALKYYCTAEVVSLLLDAKIKVSFEHLVEALDTSDLAVFKVFKEKFGLNFLNQKNKAGKNILSLAFSAGLLDAARTLLELGMSLKTLVAIGEGPLDLAINSGDIEAAKQLVSFSCEGIPDEEALCIKQINRAAELYLGAESGYLKDKVRLGNCYTGGKGLAQSAKKAAECHRFAADKGLADAQYNMGLIYQYGRGVDKSEEEAIKYFKRAMEQDYVDAYTSIGSCFYKGTLGYPQDYRAAIAYFEFAAEKEDARARYYLGMCHYSGQHFTKNIELAVECFKTAAKQGEPRAQYMLASCYQHGRSIKQNHIEAISNYFLATKQKHNQARSALKAYKDSEKENNIWHLAVLKQDPELIDYLAQDEALTASLKQYNIAGYSPLQLAVQAENLIAVECLLKALYKSYQETQNIEFLLAIDQANTAGKSALHLAVEVKNWDIVRFLLEMNADPIFFSSIYQKTPWMLAQELKDKRDEADKKDKTEILSVANSPVAIISEENSPKISSGSASPIDSVSEVETPTSLSIEAAILELFNDQKKSCAFLECSKLSKMTAGAAKHKIALSLALNYIQGAANTIRAVYIYDGGNFLYYIDKYEVIKGDSITDKQIVVLKEHFKVEAISFEYSKQLQANDLAVLDNILSHQFHKIVSREDITNWRRLKTGAYELYRPVHPAWDRASRREERLIRKDAYYVSWALFAAPTLFALYKKGPAGGAAVFLVSGGKKLGYYGLQCLENMRYQNTYIKNAAWALRNGLNAYSLVTKPITLVGRAAGLGLASIAEKVHYSEETQSLLYVLTSEFVVQAHDAAMRELKHQEPVSDFQIEQTKLVWNSLLGRTSEKTIQYLFDGEASLESFMRYAGKLMLLDKFAYAEIYIGNVVSATATKLSNKFECSYLEKVRQHAFYKNLSTMYRTLSTEQLTVYIEQLLLMASLDENNEYRTIRVFHIKQAWAMILRHDADQAKEENAPDLAEKEALADAAYKEAQEAYDRTPQGITYASFQVEDTAFFNAKIESLEQLEKLKAKRETAKAAHAAKLTTNGEVAFRSACTQNETSFYIYWSQTTSNEIQYRQQRIEQLTLQRQDVQDRLSRVEKLPGLHEKLYVGNFVNQFLVTGASKTDICSGVVGYLTAIGYIQTDAQAEIIYNYLNDSDFVNDNSNRNRHRFSIYVAHAIDKCKGWETENKESLQQQELDLNSAIQDDETAINTLTPLSKEFDTEANTSLNAVKVENPEGSSFIEATEQNIKDFDNAAAEASSAHNEDMTQGEKTLQQRNDNYDALVPFLKQVVYLPNANGTAKGAIARKEGHPPAKQEGSVPEANRIHICITGDRSGPLGYIGPYDPHGCDAKSSGATNSIPRLGGSASANTGPTHTSGPGSTSSSSFGSMGGGKTLKDLTTSYARPSISAGPTAGQTDGTGPAVDSGTSQASIPGAITSSLPPVQSFADAKPLEVPAAVPFAGAGAMQNVNELVPSSLGRAALTWTYSGGSEGRAQNNSIVSVDLKITLPNLSFEKNNDIRVAAVDVAQTLISLALVEELDSDDFWDASSAVEKMLDPSTVKATKGLMKGLKASFEKVGTFIGEEAARLHLGKDTKTGEALIALETLFKEEANKLFSGQQTKVETFILEATAFIGSELGHLSKDEQTQIGLAFANGLKALDKMPAEEIAYHVGEMLGDTVLMVGVGRAAQGVAYVGRSFAENQKFIKSMSLSSREKALRIGRKGVHERVAASASAAEKGLAGELAALKTLERSGYEFLPSKLPKNQGFDHVAILKNKDGSIKEILIVESKYNKDGTLKLASTETKGKQMSPEWIDKTILQMQESMDVAVQDTAEILLRNEDKLIFKANVLDPKGINRWGEATKIVQQLNPNSIQSRAPPRPHK